MWSLCRDIVFSMGQQTFHPTCVPTLDTQAIPTHFTPVPWRNPGTFFFIQPDIYFGMSSKGWSLERFEFCWIIDIISVRLNGPGNNRSAFLIIPTPETLVHLARSDSSATFSVKLSQVIELKVPFCLSEALWPQSKPERSLQWASSCSNQISLRFKYWLLSIDPSF